jgi:hypothetical protein
MHVEDGGLLTPEPMSSLSYEGDPLKEMFWVSECFVGEFEHRATGTVKASERCGVGLLNWPFTRHLPKR